MSDETKGEEGGQTLEFPGNPNAAPGAEQAVPATGAAGLPAQEQAIPDQDAGGKSGKAECLAEDAMTLEQRRAAVHEAYERLVDDEDKALLAELKGGQVRLLKQDGAARYMARKVLDQVTGEASIDRFVEYGNNPFAVVYVLPGQVVVEAAHLRSGVLVKYDGTIAFVPGATILKDSFGFAKIV